ncbi:hypothetical protein [Treponema zioleckii]|uniref:hypothetical protein n=1 Tax=Treponema zioleckii TaxID=331680 RepID=UPI00168AD634|nr:hypothetical protein [Treponema zioleckii]
METLQVGFENLSLLVRFPQVFLAENSRSGGTVCMGFRVAATSTAATRRFGFVLAAEARTFEGILAGKKAAARKAAFREGRFVARALRATL